MRSRIILMIGIIVLAIVCILWIKMNRTEFSPEEAKQRIRDGKYDVIVDVRTPKEWSAGHRLDAISIPIGDFVTEFPKKVPDRNTRILFVCRKGIRAPAAALMARKKGYTHAHSVAGEHDGLVEGIAKGLGTDMTRLSFSK